MKIHHDVVQGSREWNDLRLGIPTCSNFGRIMTERQMKVSAGAKNYVADLVTEKLTRVPHDLREQFEEETYQVSGHHADGTLWMKRGREMEPEAAMWYGLHRGVKLREVGFCERTFDGHRIGGSPDRLIVGEKGGLEIKIRSANQHMRRVLEYEPIASDMQVQGYLWITGYDYWDVLAYNPDFPKRIFRHHPDRAWQKSFQAALAQFYREYSRAIGFLADIEGDVVEGDNLKALLIASLKAGTEEDPNRMDADEIDAFRVLLHRAQDAGILDASDVNAALEDAVQGNWSSVRSIETYINRSLEVTA